MVKVFVFCFFLYMKALNAHALNAKVINDQHVMKVLNAMKANAKVINNDQYVMIYELQS